jgi:hypothetical protein
MQPNQDVLLSSIRVCWIRSCLIRVVACRRYARPIKDPQVVEITFGRNACLWFSGCPSWTFGSVMECKNLGFV